MNELEDNGSGRNIQESAGKKVEVVRTCIEKGGRLVYVGGGENDVDGRRRKGRQKRRWMDSVNVDLRGKGLSGEETHNRAVWRQLVIYMEVGKAIKRKFFKCNYESTPVDEGYDRFESTASVGRRKNTLDQSDRFASTYSRRPSNAFREGRSRDGRGLRRANISRWQPKQMQQ